MNAPPVGGESMRIRVLVAEAAEKAAELVARPEVAQKWEDPSSLEGMTVGALAAHLIRATGAVIAYLERSDPAGQSGEVLTAPQYFRAALEAPIHDRIIEVSTAESEPGPAALADKARSVAQAIAGRLPEEPADRLIEALEGRPLRLDDFCRTRLIETVMHTDDLAFSVGVPMPEIPGVTAEIIDVLMNIARERHGDWAVIHALGRRERIGDTPVFPVF